MPKGMNSTEYAFDMSSFLMRLKTGMTIENTRTARTKVSIAKIATCPLRMYFSIVATEHPNVRRYFNNGGQRGARPESHSACRHLEEYIESRTVPRDRGFDSIRI